MKRARPPFALTLQLFSFPKTFPNHAKMKTVAAFLLVRSPESIRRICEIPIPSRVCAVQRGDSSPTELGARARKARRRRRSRVVGSGGGGGCSCSSLPLIGPSALSLSLLAHLALPNSHSKHPIQQAQLGGNASPNAADIEKILSSGECLLFLILIAATKSTIGAGDSVDDDPMQLLALAFCFS